MKDDRLMGRLARWLLLVVCFMIASTPLLLAEGAGVVVVEADVLLVDRVPAPASSESLIVQATSLEGPVPHYVLTLANLSPWPLGNIRILERYFSAHSERELSHLWESGYLAPNQSTSTAFVYDPVEWAEFGSETCHQLEMNWSGQWSAFLMDCSGAGSTTIWSIPLTEEMAVQEEGVSLPLSLPQPVGPSKLGLHVTRNASPAIMAFIQQAQPAVVVAVGDVGWLSEVKEVSPHTITVGRFEETDQTFSGDPIQRAREFVTTHAGRYLANPGVDYWLGWNEPVIHSRWQMEWYATFEAERARLMHELGLRAAVGNFSTGTPEPELIPAFLPAIEAAQKYGGVLALHEYSAPTMLHGLGAALLGEEPSPDFGALTLRYRYWYEHYLGPANLVVPLIVTEAGIDGGVLKRTPPLGGWRDFDGTRAKDLPTQTLETYLAELSWYDDQLRRDPYVIGFAVFNAGDPKGRWASFDITEELPAFADMVLSKE